VPDTTIVSRWRNMGDIKLVLSRLELKVEELKISHGFSGHYKSAIKESSETAANCQQLGE
jgi:hypothetical protein